MAHLAHNQETSGFDSHPTHQTLADLRDLERAPLLRLVRELQEENAVLQLKVVQLQARIRFYLELLVMMRHALAECRVRMLEAWRLVKEENGGYAN